MVDFIEALWVLEGTLQTRHGSTLQAALMTTFPLIDDLEEEGEVSVTATTARIHWRTTADVTWDALVTTIRTAAPDAVGTLTVTFPYADDASPTFFVFGPDGVSAHAAYWAMTLEPFRRWPATTEESVSPEAGEPLDCPVCGTPKALEKRVNDTWDEIWVCTTCPAVLFTFHDAPQIARVADVLGVARR